MIRILQFEGLAPEEILNRDIRAEADVEAVVDEIIARVRQKGDEALLEYAKKFDHVKLESLTVTKEEIDEAMASADPEFVRTLQMAAENITRFHKNQLHKNFVMNDQPGILLGQKYTPSSERACMCPAAPPPTPARC